MIDAGGAGPRARHRTRWAAAVLGLTVLAAGCGNPPVAAPEPSYGSLPTFLPTASLRSDSVLTGSADRPALTVEGDAVQVRTAQGTVLVTVVGPQVPGSGLPYQGPTTTCTWTVTLAAAGARIPLAVSDFSSIDHFGHVYHPGVAPGTQPPPTFLDPGRSITFELRAVMTTGEGVMRWAPGNEVLASWDFVVEND